jgi:hypothetical protein
MTMGIHLLWIGREAVQSYGELTSSLGLVGCCAQNYGMNCAKIGQVPIPTLLGQTNFVSPPIPKGTLILIAEIFSLFRSILGRLATAAEYSTGACLYTT